MLWMLSACLPLECDGTDCKTTEVPTTETTTTSTSTSTTTASTTTTTTTTSTTTTDPTVTESFLQNLTPIVDVLFLVDNSCSMSNEQDALATNGPVFLDYFLGSGVDYHIGVVTTDLDQVSGAGVLREVQGQQWIDDATPNASLVFSQMISVGTTGSGTEKGLGAVYTALELEANGANAGFLRNGSAVHVIAMSDERDQTPSMLITVNQFINWFDSFRIDRSFSPIVTMQGFDLGVQYLDVNQAIGGLSYDIATADFGDALEELGILATGLTRTFCLADTPDPATLEVTVDDPSGATLQFTVPDDVALDADNCIVFVDYVPAPGATVHVQFIPVP